MYLIINLITIALSGLSCFAGILALPFAFLFSDSVENSDKETEEAIGFIVWTFAICILSLTICLFGEWKVNKSSWNVSESPNAIEHIVSLNDNNLVNGRFT